MEKAVFNQQDPDLLDEYDFSKGVQGKYAQKYREGTNIVRLKRGLCRKLIPRWTTNFVQSTI